MNIMNKVFFAPAFVAVLTAGLANAKDIGAVSTHSSVSGLRFVSLSGKSFSMQETETTRGQWKAVMGKYPEELPGWTDCDYNNFTVFEDSHPVSCVSLEDAGDFARKLNDLNDGYNYRLPTKEEWLYAAGDIEGQDYGWCVAGKTQPVGRLKPHNGLYDFVGNVMEWTISTYTSRSRVPASHKVICGASAAHSPDVYCEATCVSYGIPTARLAIMGFRLLRTTRP